MYARSAIRQIRDARRRRLCLERARQALTEPWNRLACREKHRGQRSGASVKQNDEIDGSGPTPTKLTAFTSSPRYGRRRRRPPRGSRTSLACTSIPVANCLVMLPVTEPSVARRPVKTSDLWVMARMTVRIRCMRQNRGCSSSTTACCRRFRESMFCVAILGSGYPRLSCRGPSPNGSNGPPDRTSSLSAHPVGRWHLCDAEALL